MGSRRRGYRYLNFCGSLKLPPTPHLLTDLFIIDFPIIFFLSKVEVISRASGAPFRTRKQKQVFPPYTLLPAFALTRVLTHKSERARKIRQKRRILPQGRGNLATLAFS